MFRVGLMGLGGMGRWRLQLYRQVPEAQIVAIADVRCAELQRDEALALLLERPAEPVRWYADYRDMLAQSGLDAVDICLPTGYHREATSATLEAGLPVLCEKPMALTLADCDAMIEAQRRADRTLMIAHCIRFWPEYDYLAEMARSGEAGRLLSLQLARQGPTPRGGIGWMAQACESGGAILDLHIHDVDFIQALLGLPQRVYAQGGQGQGEAAGYDYILSNWEYGDGLQISATAQWMPVNLPFVARYEARFERAFLRYDSSRTPTLAVYRADAPEAEYPPFPPSTTAYVHEIRYFLDCVRQNVSPERCPPRASRNAVALVMGAAASLECGEPMRLDEFVI